ncbi:MAG: NAD-dependent epimerase/dehydratase family protein [Oscillospiraceae bacterium]
MNALIGCTGFVGKNLQNKGYDALYHSKNIDAIVGKKYNRLVCAGIRAEKFLANQYPEQDLQAIKVLIEKLKQVTCQTFVLISTIDVYKDPIGVDETTIIDVENTQPYGANRCYMEAFVRSHYENYLIVRLPALFGKGLKKNFIYDMIHKIPSMIMATKFEELLNKVEAQQKNVLQSGYLTNDQGNWVLKSDLDEDTKEKLKTTLEQLGFTSLVFTDCRSKFPFYDLSNLQEDINRALEHNIKELNIAVEPISAQEVASSCFGVTFENTIENRQPVTYDMKSVYAADFGGKNGYLYTKEDTIAAIKKFLDTN